MSTHAVHLDDLAWTFGDRLRKLRRVLGLSQVELANDLQRTKQTVAAWELGLNGPRDVVAVAKRIELAYGIPAAWVLGVDVKTPGPEGPGVQLPGTDSNRQPFD